jgi:Spy/CpxP family protein refolding chaperone
LRGKEDGTMRRKVFLTAGLLALGLASFATVDAQQKPTPPPGEPRGPQGMQARMQKAMGLTDEQMASLRDLHRKEWKEQTRRRADLAIARMEFKELIEAPTPNQAAVDAKIKQLSDLHAASLRAQVTRHQALAKILTPEQLKQFQAMREMHKGEFGRGRGPDHAGRHSQGWGPGSHDGMGQPMGEGGGPDGPRGHGPMAGADDDGPEAD